jgi:hypothetical protein
MSAPKSVVKLSKNGVEYTSSVDKCEYYIFELSRAALRDVARYVKRKFRENYYSHFKKRTGKGPRAVYSVVMSSKKTKYPRVEIGLPYSHKGKKVTGFYSFFQELGTSKTPRLGLLTNAVEHNIAEIVKIESQYLSALEDEAKALSMIESENDYEGGVDDE